MKSNINVETCGKNHKNNNKLEKRLREKTFWLNMKIFFFSSFRNM